MALPKSIDKLRSNLSAGDVPIIGSRSSVPIQRNHPDSIKTKVDEYIKSATDTGNLLSHPSDLPIYHMTMKLYHYGAGTARRFRGYFGPSQYTIKLPLAMALEDGNTIKYGEDEVGAEFWKSIFGEGALRLASPAASMANLALGASINKGLAVMFKGPTYKKYVMSWILGARNEDESKTIRKIISAINWGAATDYGQAPGIGAAYFVYPSVFKMGFSYPISEDRTGVGVKFESDNSKWYNFKPAVCQSVSVKYLPQGHPVIMNSGYPEAVVLTCKFQEIEFWLKRDFKYHGQKDVDD